MHPDLKSIYPIITLSKQTGKKETRHLIAGCITLKFYQKVSNTSVNSCRRKVSIVYRVPGTVQ
jgi:hypothetical protein